MSMVRKVVKEDFSVNQKVLDQEITTLGDGMKVLVRNRSVCFKALHWCNIAENWARYLKSRNEWGKLLMRHNPKLLRSFSKILGQIMMNKKYISLSNTGKENQEILTK